MGSVASTLFRTICDTGVTISLKGALLFLFFRCGFKSKISRHAMCGIVFVIVPVYGIIDNILTDAVHFGFITNNMFKIIALPDRHAGVIA